MAKMPGTSNQTTSPVPSNLGAILQSLGLPMPVGTNENGEPYWMIDGKQMQWGSMQAIIWQKMQQQMTAGVGKAGSGSPEAIALPSIESGLETYNPNVEQAVESGPKSPEQSAESTIEQGVEKAETVTTAPQPSQKTSTRQASSYLGDSSVVKSVDLSDTKSMANYATTHKNASPSSSKRFLAVTLEKILLMLSLKAN